jgi:hypothetical protein
VKRKDPEVTPDELMAAVLAIGSISFRASSSFSFSRMAPVPCHHTQGQFLPHPARLQMHMVIANDHAQLPALFQEIAAESLRVNNRSSIFCSKLQFGAVAAEK